MGYTQLLVFIVYPNNPPNCKGALGGYSGAVYA
jgi:hypothetical protein